MNIKNITCRKKTNIENLIVGRQYYIVKKTNYLRIELLSIIDQKEIIFKIMSPEASPLFGAECKLPYSSSVVFYQIYAFTKGQKYDAYKKQKGICPICKLNYEFDEMKDDYIKPKEEGGRTVPDNLQMLCQTCYQLKKELDRKERIC